MSTSTNKVKNRRDFSASVVSSVGIPSGAGQGVKMPSVGPEPVPSAGEVSPAENSSLTPATDELDQILAMTGKNKHGQQKSVYFDSDVYRFIQEKSRKNGVPFSLVLNLILKEYMKKMS